MPRIIRTPASRTDVVEIVLRIRRVNPKPARKFLNAINDTLVLLSEFPGIGPKRPKLGVAIRSFPVAKYTDYLIFYRLLDDGAVCVSVHDQTVSVGKSITFHYGVYDQFGHAIPDYSSSIIQFIVLSGPGTIDPYSGMFSSEVPGAVLIEAADGATLAGEVGLQVVG